MASVIGSALPSASARSASAKWTDTLPGCFLRSPSSCVLTSPRSCGVLVAERMQPPASCAETAIQFSRPNDDNRIQGRGGALGVAVRLKELAQGVGKGLRCECPQVPSSPCCDCWRI